MVKGERIMGDKRAELARVLAARYETGECIRVLADSIGRSYGFVHRLLEESGVSFRGRGGGVRGNW